VSADVSPKKEKLKLVTDSMTEVATGVGGVGGAVGELLSPPHAVNSSTAANAYSSNFRNFLSFSDTIADKCIAILSLRYRGLNKFVVSKI